MKQLSIIAIIPILFSFLVTPIFATTDTSVSDLFGTTNATTDNTITAQQQTSAQDNALKLSLPTLTDNPSIIITFISPAEQKAPVQLEIDNKEFIDITSPYTFPALSIGKHTLEFKYQDENSTTQIYDTSIIIVPRPPIIGTPVVNSETITFSGTGLANSDIILILSSGATVLTKQSTIDSEGKWIATFDRKNLTEDIYSLNAYTRRYGYASNLSETTKFTLGDYAVAASTTNNTPLDITKITWQSINDWGTTNQNYIITGTLALLLGVLIGVVLTSQKKQKNAKKIEKKVAEKFSKIEPQNKEITLREKLMNTENPENTKPKEKVENEPVVINKIDFLKDFKKFDPDNEKGKETKLPIDVSLTSKK